jgi:hypothetical protein
MYSDCYLCPVLTKFGFSELLAVKLLDVEFHETCPVEPSFSVWTDRYTVKLIVTSCNCYVNMDNEDVCLGIDICIMNQ